MRLSTDYDFSDCKYDPRSSKFVDEICESIPAFDSYQGEERDRVFGYIVAMYDKRSPMRSKVPEYFERKIRCAELVHMPRSQSGAFNDFTKEVLEGRNDDVNKLVVAYLADLGDIDYMRFIGELTMFHSIQAAMLSGNTDDKLYKTMTSLSDSLKKLVRELFMSGERDELQRVRILLYESAEKDRRKMHPEAIVAMLNRDGDFPGDWARYGKYKPESLKFIGHELE